MDPSIPQGADLISSLPEGILISILSRLPIKDAIRTSVLSTKWIDLWTSITRVEFDDTMLHDRGEIDKENSAKFVNFVNRVLIHLNKSTIQDFSLKLSNRRYDPNMSSTWISAMLRKQVRNLHIQNADRAFISSRSLAKCSSLVQLVLDMNCTINVPSFYCLQYLQVLKIYKVKIMKSTSSTHSKDIVLNFPSLKVFEARHCVWFNIILQAPMLESFTFQIFDPWLSNAELIELQSSVFKICASPSTFSYRGHIVHDLIQVDPQFSLKGSVDIFIDEYIEERTLKTGFQSQMLLKQFHEAECLKLRLNRLLQRSNDHYFTNLPIFGRLVYLEVEMVGIGTLLNILNNSKNLKTLVLNNSTFSFDENVLTSEAIPQCFESSLKEVQFKQFRGILCEFILTKFVLRNAAILEKITFFPHWLLHNSDVGFKAIEWRILSFPRKSNVLIEFSF